MHNLNQAPKITNTCKTQMSEPPKKQRIKSKTDWWCRGGWALFGWWRRPNRVRLRQIGWMAGGDTAWWWTEALDGGGYVAWWERGRKEFGGRKRWGEMKICGKETNARFGFEFEFFFNRLVNQQKMRTYSSSIRQNSRYVLDLQI